MSISKFCSTLMLNEKTFINWLNSYLEDFWFVSLREAIGNSYILYNYKKNRDANEDSLSPVCKIKIENFLQVNNDELLLKLKITNLKYFNSWCSDLLERVLICNSSNFKYVESREYLESRNNHVGMLLPKIAYSVTFKYLISNVGDDWLLAFKNFDNIEGNGIKKIVIESKKKKDLSNRAKCPNCKSFDTIKNGKRNGKQRYQCNKCKRKFTEE